VARDSGPAEPARRFVTRFAGLSRAAACDLRSCLRCSASRCDPVVSVRTVSEGAHRM